MNRTLTPGRAISLVLIAVAALGLAYAKFGAGARHVTVPDGVADRGTLVVLSGLAAIAVALLAWTFRRRPFGRVAAALLRSVGAVAIGIGAWCAAALAATIAAPALPLDDAVFAALAAGLPVGIAIARVSRTPPPAALAGALLGASFATTPLAAVGAVAGANLGVIAFELLAARPPARV